MTAVAPWARMLVLFPDAIAASLARIDAAKLTPRTPTVPQIALGIARMHWRMLTRPETVGTCTAHPVRDTWRARMLEPRPMRFPFLVRERAIAPLDFSGLASSRERVLRHLLAAHHDGNQFAYDLELLAIHPGAMEELRERARAIVDGTDPRAAWLRDLCVYERYHEDLLEAVEAAIASGSVHGALTAREANDPDITLGAYLRWCAAQPTTLLGAWRALREGTMTFAAYEPEPAS